MSDRQLLDEVEREARQLLIRVPDAPFAHSLLDERGRMPRAAHHLTLAAEREPNDSDITLMLSITYVGSGQNAQAQETARAMMARDPLSPASWMAVGVPHWFVGRADRTIPALQRGQVSRRSGHATDRQRPTVLSPAHHSRQAVGRHRGRSTSGRRARARPHSRPTARCW